MKFSQMEYQRPDVDGMIEQYKQIKMCIRDRRGQNRSLFMRNFAENCWN